jgi:hypothetical protein
MKKAIILFIQGGGEGGYEADKRLALYLQNALVETYDINYPKMPNENDPDYNLWKAKIEQELKKTESKVVLVGHSVGSFLLLKYITEEKIDKHILGIFLISTPFLGEGGWHFDDMNLENDIASKLPPDTPVFFYHSTEDEIVPFSHLALYAKKIPNATIRKIFGRGHQLNNDLTEIVKDIKNLG